MKQGTTLIAFFLLSALTIFSGCQKDEVKIEKWIVGTWNTDRYTQETYSSGDLQGESESTNLGKIEFRKDGTGSDIGGNFIGSDFTWENTDTELILTEGQGNVTVYIIEDFSKKDFVFSITHTSGSEEEVERWYLSK